LLSLGFFHLHISETNSDSNKSGFSEFSNFQISNSQSKCNILTQEDLSKGIKDTVYTEFDCWLELRIDRQMLYQHWRNGKVESYPVSTGNKYLSRSIESRPGLFTVFFKELHHESSQYHNADMYNFMPFNQGIGFHSLNGTGYYGALGKMPSSHGCIRMRHQDVQKIYKDCPIGTLVLATRGNSCRTIGFAPKDYKNDKEYDKDELKAMLSENLYNILEGKYYVADRKYFVVNPDIIPRSGIYIGYDRKIPEKQVLPKSKYVVIQLVDRLNINKNNFDFKIEEKKNDIIASNDDPEDTLEIAENENASNYKPDIPYTKEELIKKYFHNPIGILPYFPPENK